MQISSFQKHLDVFHRLGSSLLFITSLSSYPYLSTNQSLTLFPGAILHPFFFCFFSTSFIRPKPLAFIYILPSPLVPFSPNAHASSSSLLLFLPPSPPIHRRLSQFIWSDASFISSYLVYSKDNEQICLPMWLCCPGEELNCRLFI